MSRYLRYLLIWLSCTAVSVTAVILTVHFVVGSTKPTPPVARSAPTIFSSPSEQARKAGRRSEPSPSATSRAPSPTKPSVSPSAASRTTKPATPTPSKTGSPAEGGATGTGTEFTDCGDGGSGVHTIQSAGGRASVRFGSTGVCLVSAVPTRGFTVRTSQSEPSTLSVTFSGDRQESVITATTEPEDRATVRETSW